MAYSVFVFTKDSKLPWRPWSGPWDTEPAALDAANAALAVYPDKAFALRPESWRDGKLVYGEPVPVADRGHGKEGEN